MIFLRHWTLGSLTCFPLIILPSTLTQILFLKSILNPILTNSHNNSIISILTILLSVSHLLFFQLSPSSALTLKIDPLHWNLKSIGFYLFTIYTTFVHSFLYLNSIVNQLFLGSILSSLALFSLQLTYMTKSNLDWIYLPMYFRSVPKELNITEEKYNILNRFILNAWPLIPRGPWMLLGNPTALCCSIHSFTMLDNHATLSLCFQILTSSPYPFSSIVDYHASYFS